jgi:DNA-binding transcriptional regulator YdaS (Cro superfamily)
MATQCFHFEQAVSRTFGSQAGLARMLEVTPGLVAQWHRRAVPLERCLQIERRSREIARERDDASLVVRCEDLRPDVDWRVLRENPEPVGGS